MRNESPALRQLPEIACYVREEPQRVGSINRIAGPLERAPRSLGLGTRLVESTHVAQRLRSPKSCLGCVRAMQSALQHLQVSQRCGGIAATPPRGANEIKH